MTCNKQTLESMAEALKAEGWTVTAPEPEKIGLKGGDWFISTGLAIGHICSHMPP